MPTASRFDVAIIGAGFSGLAMAARLRRAGQDDFVILERGDDVGGTWRDNTYPGCACDVPSHLYSFSFAPNPGWSSTFSPQPEIQAYLRSVARRERLVERIRFRAEVEEATWDDEAALWRLRTSAGDVVARSLVAAAGPLHEPAMPDLPGMDRFEGVMFHSARWDHEHDLTGRRVAVVGTGASAIQFVPQIQPKVDRLTIFQRTAPWVVPRRSRTLGDLEHRLYRRLPVAQKAMRAVIYWGRELLALPMLHVELSRYTEKIARSHLERSVPDPELRRKVTPDYRPGCKRILVSSDYLPALAEDNVEVVTQGVAKIRERSVVAADGTEHEVDTIIFGTGFHVTDLPIADRILGRGGRRMADVFEGSPRAYRGTTVAGFPNLYLLLGPNTGLGHTSVVFMAEAQADYVMGALEHLRRRGIPALEVRRDAQDAWNAAVQRKMRGTVWTEGGCRSWYLDRNGVNTTLWPDHTFRFRRLLRRFDAERYEERGPSRPRRDPARRTAPEPVAAPA